MDVAFNIYVPMSTSRLLVLVLLELRSRYVRKIEEIYTSNLEHPYYIQIVKTQIGKQHVLYKAYG